MNTKNGKKQNLALPDISLYPSGIARLITKPILMTFLILSIFMITCFIISFNVRIENVININGEYSGIQPSTGQISTLINEKEINKITLGDKVKLKIALVNIETEENLSSGRITSIRPERNEKGTYGYIKLYRVSIIAEGILFESNASKSAINITGKIITDGEPLIHGILKQVKGLVNM
jgi:hypothetical protein